jgi:hypothetical protein
MPRRSPSASEARPAIRRSSRLNKGAAGARVILLSIYIETDWDSTANQSPVVILAEGPRIKRRKTSKIDSDSRTLECTENALGVTDIIPQTVPKIATHMRIH